MVKIPDELVAILRAIKEASGWPLIVGGAVRDHLLGYRPKDFDIEVYQLPVESLLTVLNRFGKTDQVGVQFGIIKLRTSSNTEYDFSLPRRENKSGAGHRGFIVSADPAMTPEEACSRRDYSINAMAYDFHTSQILDFFSGQQDLKNGILRHVGPAFVEDPLRVLRGLQFVSRFKLEVADETALLCQQLLQEYSSLAKERIWGEWQKWAKSKHPSAGLRFLQKTGWIDCYSEIKNIVDVPQHHLYHPEGSVFEHSCHTSDAAAQIAVRLNLSDEKRCLLVLTALCHDYGKPTTTVLEEGIWKSPGHAEAGIPPAQSFLQAIAAPQELITHALPLVQEHLSWMQATSSKTVRRLATRLEPATIEELLWVIEADHSGRPPLPGGLPENAQQMQTKATETNALDGRVYPILMGKHLLEKGLIAPGPGMGKILRAAYEAQLDEQFRDLDGALVFAEKFLRDNP